MNIGGLDWRKFGNSEPVFLVGGWCIITEKVNDKMPSKICFKNFFTITQKNNEHQRRSARGSITACQLSKFVESCSLIVMPASGGCIMNWSAGIFVLSLHSLHMVNRVRSFNLLQSTEPQSQSTLTAALHCASSAMRS